MSLGSISSSAFDRASMACSIVPSLWRLVFWGHSGMPYTTMLNFFSALLALLTLRLRFTLDSLGVIGKGGLRFCRLLSQFNSIKLALQIITIMLLQLTQILCRFLESFGARKLWVLGEMLNSCNNPSCSAACLPIFAFFSAKLMNLQVQTSGHLSQVTCSSCKLTDLFVCCANVKGWNNLRQLAFLTR